MIIYRRADAADAEKLLAYTKTVGGETDNLCFGENSFNISVEKQARFISKFVNDKVGIMLVALDGDKIVANASIERHRIERYSHRAELSVTVLKEYWGRGIATELISRLIEFARETAVSLLYLDVRSDNERAIALYKRMGFVTVGTFPRYFKIKGKYYDAEIMTLML